MLCTLVTEYVERNNYLMALFMRYTILSPQMNQASTFILGLRFGQWVVDGCFFSCNHDLSLTLTKGFSNHKNIPLILSKLLIVYLLKLHFLLNHNQ